MFVYSPQTKLRHLLHDDACCATTAARVDTDAVFSLLTGAETEREFDHVGRRLTRCLTNGRFETLYPVQREAAWQLTFGQNPVVAQLPTGKGKGAISLLWMCATGGVVLECVPLTSIGRGHVVEASKVAGRRGACFIHHSGGSKTKGKGGSDHVLLSMTPLTIMTRVVIIIYMRGGKVIRRAELSISDSDA